MSRDLSGSPRQAGAGLSCCASSLVPSLAPSGHQSLSSCRTGSAARHADGDTAATWPACRRHQSSGKRIDQGASPRRFLIDGGLATARPPGLRILSPKVPNRRCRPVSSPSLWIDRLLGTGHRLLGTRFRLLGTRFRLLGTVSIRKLLIYNGFSTVFRSKTL